MNSLPLQFQTQILNGDTSGVSGAVNRSGILSDSETALLMHHANSHHANALFSTMPGLSFMGTSQAMPQFLPVNTPHHPIAEFLYQLTKMLTDNNREVIEWVSGRIKVHNPHRLADEVLHKYFRHSKYASFQRQLNYFGFRKIAGKGKMSPCAYVNDAATEDLRSLLFIKRKTNGSTSRKGSKGGKKEDSDGSKSPQKDSDSAKQQDDSSSLSGGKRSLTEVNDSTSNDNAKRRMTTENNTNNITSIQSNFGPSANSQQKSLSFPSTNKPMSECFHFPSENTLAVLTGLQQTANNSHVNLPLTMHVNSLSNGLDPNTLNNNSSMACPATAAMNAAVSSGNSNFYEAAPYLQSLVNEQNSMPPPSFNAGNNVQSNNLLPTLPSCNTLFPDQISSASLNHLVQQGSQLNLSWLNMNNVLSRDSLVELAMVPSGTPSDQTSLQDMKHGQSLLNNGGSIIG